MYLVVEMLTFKWQHVASQCISEYFPLIPQSHAHFVILKHLFSVRNHKNKHNLLYYRGPLECNFTWLWWYHSVWSVANSFQNVHVMLHSFWTIISVPKTLSMMVISVFPSSHTVLHHIQMSSCRSMFRRGIFPSAGATSTEKLNNTTLTHRHFSPIPQVCN